MSGIRAGTGLPDQRQAGCAKCRGACSGKLLKLTAGTEALAYGVLLDASIDTAAVYSQGSVTGSIAKAGSFRGPALIVPAGIDADLVSVALRGRGIFVEGSITVPAAVALATEENAEA